MLWKILHMQEKLDALFSDGWLSLGLESQSGMGFDIQSTTNYLFSTKVV